jgi:hypothetical protein
VRNDFDDRPLPRSRSISFMMFAVSGEVSARVAFQTNFHHIGPTTATRCWRVSPPRR